MDTASPTPSYELVQTPAALLSSIPGLPETDALRLYPLRTGKFMLKYLLMLIIPVMASWTSAPNYLLAISTNPSTGRDYFRYKTTDKLELHVDASRLWGGETEVDGVHQDDQSNQQKYMIGASYFVEPETQVLATFGQDISVENGFREGSRFNLRFLHVF